jgi:hypothetical protein
MEADISVAAVEAVVYVASILPYIREVNIRGQAGIFSIDGGE